MRGAFASNLGRHARASSWTRRRAVGVRPRPSARAPQPGATPCACGGGCPRCATAGLHVSSADSHHEREADAVAARVADSIERRNTSGVDQPGPARVADSITPFVPSPSTILRKGAAGESCPSDVAKVDDDEAVAMPKSRTGTGPSSAGGVKASLARSRGAGQPLPRALRRSMEQAFAYDFSRVRVHTDGRAARMNEDLRALAFTSGHDLYFSLGAYQPETPAGRRLLAHELTHVIQQARGGSGAAAQRQARAPVIQAYSLWGFSAAQGRQMDAAILTALRGLARCSYPSWFWKPRIVKALLFSAYHYRPGMSGCGWTIPLSNYIQIGPNAFVHSRCCDLASTVAHEASHVAGYTEHYARGLECACFGCSC